MKAASVPQASTVTFGNSLSCLAASSSAILRLNLKLGPIVNPPTKLDMRSRLLAARLPSLPQTLVKLLSMCQSEDVGMAMLSGLISSDPAITAKVLAVAHSAAYSRSDRQLNLLQATSTLGTNMIKVLVISESVFQTFHGFTRAGGADLRQFWQHSLSVAVIARELARQTNYAQADDAYLAGLLHDVGRLALLAAAPDLYLTLFGAPDDNTLCALEQQRLNMSHTDAAAWLLERWNLDNRIVQSVFQHHNLPASSANEPPLTRLLKLAHQLADLPEAEPDAVERVVSTFGLDPAVISTLLQGAAAQVAQTARDLGIDISEPVPRAVTPLPTPKPADDAEDSARTQLGQEVHDLSVLREMAQTLARKKDIPAVLTSLRQHAGVLLQLADTVVMLLNEDEQTLVACSMNDLRSASPPAPLVISAHVLVAQCVSQRHVVFLTRRSHPDDPLLAAMGTERLVLVPLVAAGKCLGIVVAAVPAELSHQIKNQGRLLQAFGVYAGMALSLRRPGTTSPNP
jgi:putative nucleotidyltransferase with HDIG domain